MVYFARFFFWFLLVSNTIKDYLNTSTNEPAFSESFFPLVESFQFPIIVFTLFSLYCIAYKHYVFDTKTMKVIAGFYILNALYLIFTPVIVYWEQSSDISVELIIFFITDFWIFWILWSNKNERVRHS